MPVDPLARFVERIRAGDELALRELHGACAGRVFGLAKRIVLRHELADEVVSTSFLQFWREAGDFDPARASVMTWLGTIARSRALDLLRHLAVRRRHEASLEDEDAERIADAAAGPCESVQSAQLRAILKRGLARLTGVQRQVLCLAFFDGLSHEEVAARACLPLGTVKSHARRGLAALRADPAIAAMAA